MTDSMVIDWDVRIRMDDGLELSANVYRPAEPGRYPVIMSYGPYGKDLSFQEAYAPRWRILERDYPDAIAGSSNVHQSWELLDPEKWVPHGYVIVRVDSRGAGRSPGVVDSWSPREAQDYAACIEWAGTQEWSTGKVGLAGVSYYAMNSWQVAALNPPHLAAFCSWEGCSDLYREAAYHGGVHNDFLGGWFPRQVESVQYGTPHSSAVNPVSGLKVTGDVVLSDDELAANRVDIGESILAHPFLDDYWRERSAALEKITVPVLSAGNWGGHGLHLRGNIGGWAGVSSREKWLEIHGREHWSLFYADYGQQLQKRFFDWYLKGEGDWAQTQPPVLLQVRKPDDTFEARGEQEWPLARTEWTRMPLDAASRALGAADPAPATAGYVPGEGGVTFLAEPFTEDVEITGPLAARLWISSETTDTDLFLVLHAYDAEGNELLFRGAGDPWQPAAQGWLRASHRALDPRSTPWQPWHPHDKAEPLVPGEPTAVDVEIWPTSLLLPAGSRIGLSVQGADFDHGLPDEVLTSGERLSWSAMTTRGSGPYVHRNERARPRDIYGGAVTIHTGGDHESWLLVPFIPAGGAA